MRKVRLYLKQVDACEGNPLAKSEHISFIDIEDDKLFSILSGDSVGIGQYGKSYSYTEILGFDVRLGD